MLAEPKHKQKWAEDPRNTQWSQDKSKFGYQLMSKMGWSEGKGLGANESGRVSHVKVSKRKENLGLGSTTNHSENWIAHQDDFNALLSNLNQKKNGDDKDISPEDSDERASLKSSVKQSRKKIFYSKFIHSKDLSLKSKNDLACVMGQRSKSTPATPQELSEDEGVKSDTSTASCPVGDADKKHGIVTTKSKMNLEEYFAIKMAALKKRKEGIVEGSCNGSKGVSNPPDKDEDVNVNNPENETKKKRKKKKGGIIEEQDNENSQVSKSQTNDDVIEDNSVNEPKKKRKKRKVHVVEEVDESSGVSETLAHDDATLNNSEEEAKKKRKKKKEEIAEEQVDGSNKVQDDIDAIIDDSRSGTKKKRKKDKKEKDRVCEEKDNALVDLVDNEKSKKRKREGNVKASTEEQVSICNGVSEDSRKSKKQKRRKKEKDEEHKYVSISDDDSDVEQSNKKNKGKKDINDNSKDQQSTNAQENLKSKQGNRDRRNNASSGIPVISIADDISNEHCMEGDVKMKKKKKGAKKSKHPNEEVTDSSQLIDISDDVETEVKKSSNEIIEIEDCEEDQTKRKKKKKKQKRAENAPKK